MPIFMNYEGIKGSVTPHVRQPDSFVFAKATPTGDDVIVDGRIITAENHAAASGEGRPMENLALNFTKITYEAAVAPEPGGVFVALGDVDARDVHTDFALL